MIATVETAPAFPQQNQVLAGFVGEDAQERAAAFCAEQPKLSCATVVSTGRRLNIQTRDLRPGDVLVPTLACFLGSYGLRRNKVFPHPSAGTRTPKGKLDVLLRHPQGRLREATWGRYTKLTIVRHTSEED